MSESDHVVFDRDLLIEKAKRRLVELSRDHLAPVPREEITVSGCGGEMNLQNIVRSYRARGLATEHDALIASKLARVLTDGGVACIHTVNEDRISELEREAFMSLAGEKRTRDRIEHMLEVGKPLRN